MYKYFVLNLTKIKQKNDNKSKKTLISYQNIEITSIKCYYDILPKTI